jgi:hypothetical protein
MRGEVTSSGCEEPFLPSRVPCAHASTVSSHETQRLILGALPGAAVHCCRASTDTGAGGDNGVAKL